MTETDPPVVVIVEDEPAVAEPLERWLRDGYEIRRARDDAEALDVVDDGVDVVLVDRTTPDRSGRKLLREIRERGADCRIAMIADAEPDVDAAELGFDAAIGKPPDRDDLLDTVETLLDRADVDDDFRDYQSLETRRGALEAEMSPAELETDDEYQELLDRIEETAADVDEGLGDMGSDVEFVSAVRDVATDNGGVQGRNRTAADEEGR